MTETAQLDAILHGAAFAVVNDRAFLRVTGADATRWLNGMVTNNIAALTPGEGNYNFLLNAQGRIIGDCTIYREPGDGAPTFLLETQNSQLETIHKTLDHFIIMDDVELTPPSTGESSLLLVGPEAPAILTRLNLPALEPLQMANASSPYGPVLLYTPSKGAVPSFTLCGDTNTLVVLRGLAIDAPAVSADALEAFRIVDGRPKYGTDIRNTDTAKDLPQETGQTHALHFAKGCYLGQEIVERIRSRGQVHRQFTQFKLSGELPTTLPAPLEANGKPAGELTSAAQIGDTIYALGYARREALDTHRPLTYPGGTALATGRLATGTESRNAHG